MNKLERAARNFCLADDEVRAFRSLWRTLKQDHKAEDVCAVDKGREPTDWCEACQAYPMAGYKTALKRRQQAKNSMRIWYERILKQEAERGSFAEEIALMIAMNVLRKIAKSRISQDNAAPPAHRIRFEAKEAIKRIEKLLGVSV